VSESRCFHERIGVTAPLPAGSCDCVEARAYAAGFAEGQKSILRVVEQWQSTPAQAADLRYRILAACNAATPATEE
jgi:hypothetical protein